MATNVPTLLIEGYSADELLRMPAEELEAFAFTGEALILQVGSGELLGRFRRLPDRLEVELAQVDRGGEGILLALWRLARQLASARGLTQVEWIVHAVHCARPNLKLRRVLERRGFVVRELPGRGSAYHFIDTV